MLAQSGALDIHQVAPFGEEVANKGALNDGQATVYLLPRLGDEGPNEKDSATSSSFADVLHELEVVQLLFHAAPRPGGLPDIKSLKRGLAPSASEDIDAGTGWQEFQVDGEHRTVASIQPHGQRFRPVDLQLHNTATSRELV